MKHTHPLQKRRKIKRHKMVWRHQGEGPGSDWVEAQTSAWRRCLCPPYVLQVCFMLVQVRWCLFLHFHPPLSLLSLHSHVIVLFSFHCCSFWSFLVSSGVQAWLCSDPTDPPDHPYSDLWLSSLTSEARAFPLPDGKSTHVFGPRATTGENPRGARWVNLQSLHRNMNWNLSQKLVLILHC